MELLKSLKNDKGIIMHPATWIVGAFIVGLLVMYLIVKGALPLPRFLSWLKP